MDHRDDTVIELAEETLVVGKQGVDTAVSVRVSTEVDTRTAEIDLVHMDVVVERVPVGRTVTERPEIRQEGDTTIVPIFEEIMVVTKQLVLTEELHIRRISRTEHVREPIALRRQTVTTDRRAVPE